MSAEIRELVDRRWAEYGLADDFDRCDRSENCRMRARIGIVAPAARDDASGHL